MRERAEWGLVEQFVPQPADERLGEGVFCAGSSGAMWWQAT